MTEDNAQLNYHPDDLRESSRADLRDIVDLQWSTALDNHEPIRGYAYGRAQRYSQGHVTDGVVLWGHGQLKDATRAFYLLDDGRTVRPYYVAGWLAEGTTWDENNVARPGPNLHKADPDVYVVLHPFPVNYDAEGNRLMRPDGRPVDHSYGLYGPRRAYHLKVTS